MIGIAGTIVEGALEISGDAFEDLAKGVEALGGEVFEAGECTIDGVEYVAEKTAEGVKYTLKSGAELTEDAAILTYEGAQYLTKKTVEGVVYEARKGEKGLEYFSKETGKLLVDAGKSMEKKSSRKNVKLMTKTRK